MHLHKLQFSNFNVFTISDYKCDEPVIKYEKKEHSQDTYYDCLLQFEHVMVPTSIFASLKSQFVMLSFATKCTIT